ncbi:MAG: TetR/AcrR family transcriptional regulator C-terminal domain-containing protein [Eubacteriaceae bacterium]|nr:TetR/AcrR family transcriptional regulator C-terminal domain-containing protein [Eubacteriaceae bacterium]
MANKKNTKRALADSFLELIDDKPLAKISVLDIVKRCGAGRQTFYNHFHDKYALIGWIFATEIDEAIKKHGHNDPKSTSEDILRIIKSHSKLFIAVGEDATVRQNFIKMYRILYTILDAYYLSHVQEILGAAEISEEVKFAVNYHCYAFSGTINEWVQQGCPGSVERIAQLTIQFMPDILQSFYPPNFLL